VLDALAEETEVEVPGVMVDEKADEMVSSFERSIRAQGIEPEQYYQLAGSSREDVRERVREDAADTVKKELVLDAIVAAEQIQADEHEMMHQIEHLAEDSERSPSEVAELMRRNGTYALLQEELARNQALEFLAENAVPVPMPPEEAESDEEIEELAAGTTEETGDVEVVEASRADGGEVEEVRGAGEPAPEAGESRVEASVQIGESSTDTEKNAGKE
jgi:trigger factor